METVLKIRNHKDFWAGMMFLAFGLFFAGMGTDYTFGSAARMGPGYFPTVLGVILCLIGVAVSLASTSRRAPAEKVHAFDWKILFFVLGPITLFGLTLDWLGLYLSLFILVVLTSFASHEFRWKATVVNALVLVILCYVVFVHSLELQFPLWPTFISR